MKVPEFEKEFYVDGISSMCIRYEKAFKMMGVPWKKFYTAICKSLNEKIFYIWEFLCGLDPVLAECIMIPDKIKMLEKLKISTQMRIYNITKEERDLDFFLKHI